MNCVKPTLMAKAWVKGQIPPMGISGVNDLEGRMWTFSVATGYFLVAITCIVVESVDELFIYT